MGKQLSTCPNCGEGGEVAEVESDQALLDCRACGHRFLPREKPYTLPRRLPLRVCILLAAGGRLAQYGWGAVIVGILAGALFFPHAAASAWQGADAALAGLAGLFLLVGLLGVGLGILSNLGVLGALRSHALVAVDGVEYEDTGFNLGGSGTRGVRARGSGLPIFRVKAPFVDRDGQEREARTLFLGSVVHRVPGGRTQVLYDPENPDQSLALGTLAGRVEITRDGRVRAHDSPLPYLVQPGLAVLALLVGLTILSM